MGYQEIPYQYGAVIDYDGDTVPENWEEVLESEDYSTEEVNTGRKWIDGKEIYRKVVEFTTSSSTILIDTEIYNSDTVISLTGMLSAGKPINFTLGEHYIHTWVFNNENNLLELHSQTSESYANFLAYAIIEYTKTE